ncbi:MAG: flagellar basal body L-ring protein FlgH [Terricaulis sp.]
MKRSLVLSAIGALVFTSEARAENLYHGNDWANVAGDRHASAVGDVLTIVVYQNTQAHDVGANVAHKRQSLDATAAAGQSNRQSGSLSLDGAYSGQGELSRTQSFITQLSVTVTGLTDNGDLLVAGAQHLNFNGEHTTIHVRGRVRQSDIDANNAVLSTRIADAEIDYDGRGFVSRNAGPGIVQRLFALLGLGG